MTKIALITGITGQDGSYLAEFLIEKSEERQDGNFVIGGYVRKFANINENGEKFLKTAYDRFIERYYETNKLNIPVDVMHGGDIFSICGKVITLERVDTVGIWCEIEISKNAIYFEKIKGLIQDGILQGLSDYGWATDYEPKYLSDGTFSHYVVKEQNLIRVSIVDSPSEPQSKVEVLNATKFIGFKENKKEVANGFLGL